jgi:hypothetical protein
MGGPGSATGKIVWRPSRFQRPLEEKAEIAMFVHSAEWRIGMIEDSLVVGKSLMVEIARQMTKSLRRSVAELRAICP